ncbi:MAG: ATP-binding cassette domain-containing protein [Bacteroidetes bacterium]|nr:MAG: ATP-binding cassette domain-containing protein [Bacteroidota bacterium]
MSERIFRALMQLFAIIAKVDDVNENEDNPDVQSSNGRRIIESFLKTELNASLVREYIKMFDEFLATHHSTTSKKDGRRKRTSLNSVKVLRICSQINEELTQRQKFIVLLRIFEFIHANELQTEQEEEFVNTVAETFNIDNLEYRSMKEYMEIPGSEIIDGPSFLYITSTPLDLKHARQIVLDGIENVIRVLRIESVQILFFRYFGTDELNMNGQFIPNDRNHILNQGSSLRTSKSQPIYYSDVLTRFLNDQNEDKLIFKVSNLTYHFKGGKLGLHETNFTEQSGKLVGLMGGSGAGKSTLLNVLNGNYTPSNGSVTINGIDVHKEKSRLEGVIGFISQDDLLIEELTVFQNLFFNAKLCFNDLTDTQITKKVVDLLSMIGLHEAMHLKVGSPLEKTISGGQRKRLNIALELIREPSVLFVDEPTSGLSSRDSENIMDLLKELALKGKLIFVVIHQPSSDIFKMFDRLIILDQGGYPIFDGNPIDAVVYFKMHVNHVNADERECYACGNVNPEQIFNIIESKVVDEYGNLTKFRKTLPEEWNEKFQNSGIHADPAEEEVSPLKSSSKIPSRWKQFMVFFKRDILSKLSNKQYMLINMLEAPVLALILAFFVKFYDNKKADAAYVFYENINIPQYIFIAVVVSLFLGLTVAAEEIIKDKKILKRESFLNLSRTSYIVSKIGIMFIISGIQTMFFVAIGNFILEIKGMWLEYWFILFSTSCVANVMGLNISSAFNSAKVIYITVPLLIIPQLLFSGVIVKFEKLHPLFSNTNEVPIIGNIMVSRWAYEALIVEQAVDNEFQRKTYDYRVDRSQSGWKRDYWIPEIRNKLDLITNKKTSKKDFDKAIKLLVNEIKKEERSWANLECKDCVSGLEKLKNHKDAGEVKFNIETFLNVIKKQYNKTFNESTEQIDKVAQNFGEEEYKELKEQYENESLHDLVTNRMEISKIVESKNELFQKDDPIYLHPKYERFFDAHFYAPSKYLFGIKLSTFWANMLVIWVITFLSVIALYFDLLKKFLDLFDKNAAQ